MRSFAVAALLLIAACSSSTPATATPASSPTPLAIRSPSGAQLLAGGCGSTAIYKGGTLPPWASVNAPTLPYVVADDGLALGYLFSNPLKAGIDAQNKILWYVGAPRNGSTLRAQGHPLGADAPTATFSKAADSSPGEIYPTGPTVPSPGSWRFTLTWQDGAQRTDVDLLFS